MKCFKHWTGNISYFKESAICKLPLISQSRIIQEFEVRSKKFDTFQFGNFLQCKEETIIIFFKKKGSEIKENVIFTKNFHCSKLMASFKSLVLSKGWSPNLASFIRDTMKVFNDFKNKEKLYKVMFFHMSKYIYSESVFNILYIEIKHKY